jgi:hypothetical protein
LEEKMAEMRELAGRCNDDIQTKDYEIQTLILEIKKNNENMQSSQDAL